MVLREIDDRQIPEAFSARQHGRDDALGGQAELRERGDLVGDATLDHLVQHGPDGGGLLHLGRGAVMGERLLPVLVRHAGDDVAGKQVEIDVFEGDRAFHQLT